ncbi:MAG: hypothetical protein Q7S03_00030 [bacterium]|nr:hypothetical protein [bacterium]
MVRDNYDLEERTAHFGEEIIILCKKVPKTAVVLPIVDQLVKMWDEYWGKLL